MATAAEKPKTAMELLAEAMGKLVDDAASRMSDEEFKEAEKKSAEITGTIP